MRIPRWHGLAALLLVGIGSVRIASTWRVFSHTIDEPGHLAAGLEYLSTGKYRFEDAHPPLARVFAAVGPYLAGERFHPGPGAYSEAFRILGRDAHYDRVLALGRAGILPFFWLASLVIFLWARRAGGPAAALAATLVFTTLPPVLAHAAVVTNDMAACAFTAAAALALLYWADVPDARRSLCFGAALGLACVSKFTAITFLAAGWLLVGAASLVAARRNPASLAREAWRRRRSIALVLATAFLVVWAVYGFSFARVEFLRFRMPAPRFFAGLHQVWVYNRMGFPAYIFGRRGPDGFWYYFPAALSVKTPLGMLLLLLAAPWLLRSRKYGAALWMALALSAGILLFGLTARINIGTRHVLPVYAGLSVVCGCAAAAARGRAARVAVALLLAWQVVSGALRHPDYLAYTNEIAGSHPERFVADSDLDWGQDMNRLAAFLAQSGVARLTFAPFNRTYLMAGHAMPALAPGESSHPSPGWNAVSVTIWKVFGFPAWADRTAPQFRIGRSIFLWHFPEQSPGAAP